MKKVLQITPKEPVVMLASDIVFAQRQEWCEAKYRQLHLSFLKPRCHYPYDERKTYLLFIWLSGCFFIEVDRNVWMPELMYFAKDGYAVASVEYSVTGLTRFPQQLEDIKQAIRFLRAHAEELQIQPEHIAIMGESAGGYFSALTALTNHDRQYDKGEYLDQSSAVQVAIPWYPATEIGNIDPIQTNCHRDIVHFPDLVELVTPDAPPFMILHGLSATLMNYHHSEVLYNALQAAGVESDLYLVEGADHADHRFVQDECKALILEYLDSKMKTC